MKKLTALLLVVVLAVCSLASCGPDYAKKSEGVMTYAEYDAAALDTEVVIEGYVQATQSWWDNQINVYLADPDGAYYVYELACSEADAAKLTPGTKIKVTGTKSEWSGEIEIMDATFEFVDDLKYTAAAKDVTSLIGTDDLIKSQNQKVVFKGMTVVSVEYKNGERGDDVYLTCSKGENEVSFCVEMYLTGPDTDVYKAVEALEAGDVVDVEAFLYWYNGANPHVIGVTAQ